MSLHTDAAFGAPVSHSVRYSEKNMDAIVNIAFAAIGLAILIFTFIGIGHTYDKYKRKKWQREYGSKLEAETLESARQNWTANKIIQDKLTLLEEQLESSGMESVLEKIDQEIASKDYAAEYEAYKKDEENWETLSLLSMSGGLPEHIRTLEDWKKGTNESDVKDNLENKT